MKQNCQLLNKMSKCFFQRIFLFNLCILRRVLMNKKKVNFDKFQRNCGTLYRTALEEKP